MKNSTKALSESTDNETFIIYIFLLLIILQVTVVRKEVNIAFSFMMLSVANYANSHCWLSSAGDLFSTLLNLPEMLKKSQ